MERKFIESIRNNPIISAVHDLSKLDDAIKAPTEIIFLLRGSILDIKDTVDKVKSSGKEVYLHLDLLDGFSKDQHALRYIKSNINPDGIITTKSSLIKVAKEMNFFTIQRLFILDSLSVQSGINSVLTTKPDAVEILPGIIYKITAEFYKKTKIPIINGGLITSKEEVIKSLASGAVGISTTNEKVWYM
jgi:glycerol uptake operon antiterminator